MLTPRAAAAIPIPDSFWQVVAATGFASPTDNARTGEKSFQDFWISPIGAFVIAPVISVTAHFETFGSDVW